MSTGITVINEIHIYQTLANVTIDVNGIESTTGSLFTVFLCGEALYIYGYSPRHTFKCKDKTVIRYISKSEIKVLSNGDILENGILRSFFSTPASKWELPKTHRFKLELLNMAGNVSVSRVAPQVLNQRACPFKLIMRKKSRLDTGISVQHLECRITDHSVIDAFKYHDGMTYHWNLESLSLFYGTRCVVKGLSIGVRLVISVIGDVHTNDSQANIKIKNNCALISSDMAILRSLPSFTITRESTDDQQKERVLMKNAKEHIPLESRIKRIKESKPPSPPRSLTQVDLSTALGIDSFNPYSAPMIYEITYTTPPDKYGISRRETVKTSNPQSIPENARVVKLQPISSDSLPPACFSPTPVSQIIQRRPSVGVTTSSNSSSSSSTQTLDENDEAILEIEDDPIPQTVLDESVAFDEAHKELSMERLDMRESFQLDDDFKKKNEPFFHLYGNLNLKDRLYSKESPIDTFLGTCTVCLVNVACGLYTCGHLATCKGCTEVNSHLSDTCPLCNQKIISVTIPFL
jgi:hypothetical protein